MYEFSSSCSSSCVFFALLFIIIFGVRGQIQSDITCVTSGSEQGFCLPPSQCKPSFFSEPTVCQYSEFGMKICCPKDSSTKIKPKEDNSPHSVSDSDDRDLKDRFHILYGQDTGVSYESHTFQPPYNLHKNSYQNNNPYYHRPTPAYDWLYNTQKPSTHSNVNNGFGFDYLYVDTNRPSYESAKDDFIWNDGGNKKTENKRPLRNQQNYNGNSVNKPDTNKRRISEIKCEEYIQPVSQTIGALPLSLDADVVPLTIQKCEFSALTLIVGGKPTDPGEFPHMAAVGFQNDDDEIVWNCGGTLISEEYVLTAGHCTNTTYGDPVVVRLGEYNLASDEDGAQPQDFTIAEVIPHSDYIKSIKYNDIALLRLSRPVEFTKRIRPACLHQGKNQTPVNKTVATGWGRTDHVGRLSDVLMKVSLSIINNSLCNNFYQTNKHITLSFARGITDSMICAGEIEGGVDTCFGDSGGPLQIISENNTCVYYVVGITSFGKVCGASQSPGVYTRVSSYISWIESVVWSK